MTAPHIDRVVVTNHAIEDRVKHIDGVDADFVRGRLRNGHGFFHKDTEDKRLGAYEMYCSDKQTAINFFTRNEGYEQVAVVKTVFIVRNHHQRYFATDRFESVER